MVRRHIAYKQLSCEIPFHEQRGNQLRSTCLVRAWKTGLEAKDIAETLSHQRIGMPTGEGNCKSLSNCINQTISAVALAKASYSASVRRTHIKLCGSICVYVQYNLPLPKSKINHFCYTLDKYVTTLMIVFLTQYVWINLCTSWLISPPLHPVLRAWFHEHISPTFLNPSSCVYI